MTRVPYFFPKTMSLNPRERSGTPQYTALTAALLLLTLATFCACVRRSTMYEYRPTPVDGWEQSDTLRFHADTVRRGGVYALTLGVRSSRVVPYPFQTLWLVVRQQWHNPDYRRTDTVECRLALPNGDDPGHGVTVGQYVCPVTTLQVREGASADFTVTHFMRRELLPGITDVGLRLRRVDK